MFSVENRAGYFETEVIELGIDIQRPPTILIV
jgi:hypothetical protein